MKSIFNLFCLFYIQQSFAIPTMTQRLNRFTVDKVQDLSLEHQLTAHFDFTRILGLRKVNHFFEMTLHLNILDQDDIIKWRAKDHELEALAHDLRDIHRVKRILQAKGEKIHNLSRQYVNISANIMTPNTIMLDRLDGIIRQFDRQLKDIVKLAFVHSYFIRKQGLSQDLNYRRDRSTWTKVISYQLILNHLKSSLAILQEHLLATTESPIPIWESEPIFLDTQELSFSDMQFEHITQQQLYAPAPHPHRTLRLPDSAYQTNSNECVICQGHEIAELPCGHRFHTDCLNSLLEHQNTCPLCREIIPSTSQDDALTSRL